MRLPLGLALLTFTLTELVGPGIAAAAMADCMSPDGSCEVSNDAGDFVSCACADGTGVAGGGTNDWAGLSEIELQPICEEQLAMLCGPVPPPTGVECVSPAGTCVIDNVPEDSLSCECADGSGGGMVGGNMWAGLSEMELLDQCNMELASLCGGAPPPPPPPSLECSSPLGECIINNQPADLLECVCADGMGFEGGGGNDWAELSEEELLMLCEEALANGCAAGSETGGETEGETGEPGDTGETGGEGSTGGAGSTGEPGETGVDDSGGISEGSSGGNPPPPTTGDDATGGEGSEGGADGDGGSGSGGCSVAPRSTPGGWALALLSLVGVGWRRRRTARRAA